MIQFDYITFFTPTFVRCRLTDRNWDGRGRNILGNVNLTAHGRWPTFQGPPFQGSLQAAACWSSSRADPALRQDVDRAGMNLTQPTSPKPAESSESHFLALCNGLSWGCSKVVELLDVVARKKILTSRKTEKKTLRFVESHLKKPSPLLRKWQVNTCFCFISPPLVSENATLVRWTNWAMQRWQRCASIRPRGFGCGSDRCEAIGHPKAVEPGRLLLYIAIRMTRCLLRSGKLGMI